MQLIVYYKQIKESFYRVNNQKIEELRALNKQMLENMKTKTQDEIVTKFVVSCYNVNL